MMNLLERLGFKKATTDPGLLTDEERRLIFGTGNYEQKVTQFAAQETPAIHAAPLTLDNAAYMVLNYQSREIKQLRAELSALSDDNGVVTVINELREDVQEMAGLVTQLNEVGKKRQQRDKKRHNQWQRRKQKTVSRRRYS